MKDMTMHIAIQPFPVPSDSRASPTKRGPDETKRARNERSAHAEKFEKVARRTDKASDAERSNETSVGEGNRLQNERVSS